MSHSAGVVSLCCSSAGFASVRVPLVGRRVKQQSSVHRAKPAAVSKHASKVVCGEQPTSDGAAIDSVPARINTPSRRDAILSAFTVGVMAVGADDMPSLAAYGEGANVFGQSKAGTTDFIPYGAEEGFAVLIPSKYQPSKEREFPGTVFRYEDNGDTVNSMIVTINPTSKNSITDYGDPMVFLSDVADMLGKATQTFESSSEGGFGKDRVAAAAVLDSRVVTKKGKPYYELQLLTRTADGNEGGRHHLFSATVANSKLYILKHTVGDKRWFKGADKWAQGSLNSFIVG